RYFHSGGMYRHQAYPVVDEKGQLLGVITRTNLLEDWVGRGLNTDLSSDVAMMNVIIAYDLIQRSPITAYAWESCRSAAERMAEAGVGRLLVVADDNPQKMIGIVTRSDLLKPRAREVEEEVKRERFFGVRPVGIQGEDDVRFSHDLDGQRERVILIMRQGGRIPIPAPDQTFGIERDAY